MKKLSKKTLVITGNYAAAYAVKSARVEVVAAYPITPQTSIVEKIAEFVESGLMNAKYIRVESEHSAMAACIGASAAGVRAFTATSSHGLAYMHEMLHWAARARLPIVMAVVNRAMATPWNIWSDHQDSISQRDTGWIQFYVSNNQEVYDTVIQAYRLCEDEDIYLPAFICLDAFILSHTSMPVTVYDEEDIDKFLPRYEAKHWKLDVDNPVTNGNIVSPDHYYEMSWSMDESMRYVKKKFPEICEEYKELFGQWHGVFTRGYRVDDAEYVIIAAGTLFEESCVAVDLLRETGVPVGALKIRVYRPFPAEDILSIARKCKMLITLDRSLSYGFNGPIFNDVRSAIYGETNIPVFGYAVGLGGRDVTFNDITNIVKNATSKLEEGFHSSFEYYSLKVGGK